MVEKNQDLGRPGSSQDLESDTEHHRSSNDEISLFDIVIVLAKHKKIILGVPFIAAVLTAGITLLMPNIYTGRAVLMPPQQQSSTALMLGQIGALTGVLPSSLGLKNPNDLYVGMLKSRTIADALIDRFKLRELYEEETLVQTRKVLAENTTLTSSKDGLIFIDVDDTDPRRAADLANGYVRELIKLTQNLAITEASQRRLFFESQLTQAKESLAKAEIELKRTQEHTGMIALDEQGRATIEAAAMLRAQVTAKEVEMAAMRTFATDANPDYRRTQEELIGLRNQLAKMERNTERVTGDVLISTGKIPAAGLEYVRKLRDVKYYETIFELMAKQYEVAKMDEAKDVAIIQVVDEAIPLDRKSKPRRGLIVVLFTIMAGLVGLLGAFGVEAWNRLAETEGGILKRDRFLELIRIRKTLGK